MPDSHLTVADVLTKFGIEPSSSPQRILVVHDPLKDLDDTVAQVGEAGLHHAGLVRIVGALGVLKPAVLRARAIKGGFVELGLPRIPVAVGSEITDKEQASDYEGCSYLAPEGDLDEGNELFCDVKRAAVNSSNGVHLLIAAGMTDIAVHMLKDQTGFARAVRSVTIMGGVQIEQAETAVFVALDEDGFMTPDSEANNAFDPEAAKVVYRLCQVRGIPLTVLTREAAYACQVNLAEFYTRMAATGSPIGRHLVDAQAPSMRVLWNRANAPAGSTLRGTLPARCNRSWFVNTFCGGNDPGDAQDIWPHVSAGQAYDLMAFLASIPTIRDRFFAPIEVVVRGTTHRVIGLNKDWNDGEVADIDGLREFMHELCIATLAQYQRRTA